MMLHATQSVQTFSQLIPGISSERMLRILKKQGFTKKPQWTAFEFVQFVEEKAKHIAPIVKDITQTYWRARFGQQQWSKDYSDKMQYQLAMLKPT